MMRKVDVALGARSYQVGVGSGILSGVVREMSGLGLEGRVLVVSNTTVAPLYANRLETAFREFGWTVFSLVLPDGENYKNLETTEKIYHAALDAGLDRAGTILALGGGVIGDMAGFAAATYMRGINFVQVPTTLLAQVDASVGGKVAVNHPRGKNLIGAFYQPRLVWADVDTFDTLPRREILSGLAEVIKYGIIIDAPFFSYLENNLARLARREKDLYLDLVEISCRIKAGVVSEDEEEKGRREILNFGHTIGHALEAAACYEIFRHGEAVAVGMAGAAVLARELGLISAHEVERIRNLMRSVGLPVRFSGISWEKIWYHLQADKKVKKGNINFILPTSVGTVVTREVGPDLIQKVVEREIRA